MDRNIVGNSRVVREKKSTFLLASTATIALFLAAIVAVTPSAAYADDAAPAADAAAAPADAPPAPTAMTTPAMLGTISANAAPASFSAGPLGKVYVTGALTGLAFGQTSPIPGDRTGRVDLSNGQVVVQTTDGPVQFYAQVGAYSLPTVGVSYLTANKATDNLFGAVPIAYVKLVPSDSFSVMAGKLPTLIGAEGMFTYQNMNIERGLLWNQENVINDGVQANYTIGPLALSAAVSTGFYGNTVNWFTGAATYTIDTSNTLAFQAGGPATTSSYSSFATSPVYNNSQIYDLSYTYTSAPWVISPYIQYTVVPKNTAIGVWQEASTFGAALLASYTFDSPAGLSVAGRVEYIGSSGSAASGAPSLLYGPGSNAWSVTVTPTYQADIFFVRAEASYVGAGSITSGSAFGSSGNTSSQARFLLETGIVF